MRQPVSGRRQEPSTAAFQNCADASRRLSRKVRKRGRSVAPDASPEALHPLRKSAKKLRYGIEFIASLYPEKDIKRFVKPLKALQESLGWPVRANAGRRTVHAPCC
jgi:CHAD domain-containing protein